MPRTAEGDFRGARRLRTAPLRVYRFSNFKRREKSRNMANAESNKTSVPGSGVVVTGLASVTEKFTSARSSNAV
jgi:hypothetical protein